MNLHKSFISLCMSYGLVPQADLSAANQALAASTSNSPQPIASPSDRRDAKIRRFKNDRLLRELVSTSSISENSCEELDRLRTIQYIHLAISASIQELEAIEQEQDILEVGPLQHLLASSSRDPLERERQGPLDWRLDRAPSLLDSHGKVDIFVTHPSYVDLIGTTTFRYH